MKEEKDMTNFELLNQLVYYGCDMYYYEYWEKTIKEIANRLNLTEIELNKLLT